MGSSLFPVREGGLGIKHSQDWNRAAMLKLLWRILTNQSSIWASWIKAVKLKGRSLWELRTPVKASWAWRKIMASRDWCNGMFTVSIGNGASTSLWFDHWLPSGEKIFDICPTRIISTTGLPWTATVADIISNGNWSFPNGHVDLQPIWESITFLPKIHVADQFKWKGKTSGKFSIASAWNMLRDKKPEHPLHALIWYRGHVPRYSMTLWLASKGRLSTMDRPQMCNLNVSKLCSLCGEENENHEHLFSTCSYTATVWKIIATKAQIQWHTGSWEDLLMWAAQQFSSIKGLSNLIAKHCVATTVYFLWTERNNRIFNSHQKPHGILAQEVISQVRLLLMNVTGNIAQNLKERWNI